MNNAKYAPCGPGYLAICLSFAVSLFFPPSSSPVLKSRLNLKEPHNLLCRFRSKSDTDNDNLDYIQRPPGKDAGLPCVIDFHFEPRYAAHSGQLNIPRHNLERYGLRSFSCAGPSQWNALPEDP